MKKNLRILSALGLLAACGVAAADDAPTVSTAPSLSSVLASSGITATGYVSASYYNLSTDAVYGHQFDLDHNTFSLDQASFTVSYLPASGFGASAMIVAGEDATVLTNPSAPPSAGAPIGGNFAVPTAYLQYKSGIVTIMAGKLLTLAGAEVIAPTGNTQFSRGLLFTNLEPLFHTGVRAAFAPTDKFTFTVGVNNGWNNAFDTTNQNPQKTLEFGASYAPMANLSFALNGYLGNENSPGPGQPGATNLFDVVISYSPTEALSFVLNYDNKSVKDNPGVGTLKSDGIALYGNWMATSMLRLSLRLEQVKDDGNGGLITKVANEKIKDVTFTLALLPSKSSEIRFEVRQDKASDDIFTDTDGSATDKQTEFAIQALYKF